MYPTPILLAVSGGLDSMVMLHRMVRDYRKENVAVAHCNFKLRGHESNQDEDFVRDTCRLLGVQFHCEQIDAEGYAKDHRLGIQEAARNIRYSYFDQLKQTHGYSCVATAHHRDDSIETYLINMLRGSGPEGLSGIKDDVETGLIRPLIAMERVDIHAYAERNGIDWREDSSNSSHKYFRNRIRLELLPLIKDMRPGAEKAIARNMEIQAELVDLLAGQVEDYRSTCCREEGDTQYIELDGRAGESLILGKLLSDYGFNRSQVKDILDSEESGAQVLAGGHVLTFHKGHLELTSYKPVEPGSWYIHEDLLANSLPIAVQFRVLDSIPRTLDQGSQVAILDAKRLKYPLVVRSWQAGDRIRPLGMHGEKKVSDLLNAAGCSVEEKKKVFVLLSGEDIVWVIGHRVNDLYKVRPGTKAVLHCTLDPCK